jgi:hypothetical protein
MEDPEGAMQVAGVRRQWSYPVLDLVYYNTNLPGKTCPLAKYFHDHFEVTKGFLIDYEAYIHACYCNFIKIQWLGNG